MQPTPTLRIPIPEELTTDPTLLLVVVVVFTLNPFFYPTTSAVHPVSAPILHPRDIPGTNNSVVTLCLAFVACFLLFFFLFFVSFFFSLRPGMFYLFRVPSSVQQPSATLSKYVFYSTFSFCLLSFVSYLIAESFCFFIRVVFLFSFS